MAKIGYARVSSFPSTLELTGVSYRPFTYDVPPAPMFPYPLEVIGGSYKYWDRYESKSISGFPPPFEVTGVSYSKSKDPKRGLTFRFRTLSRRLGVLTFGG